MRLAILALGYALAIALAVILAAIVMEPLKSIGPVR